MIDNYITAIVALLPLAAIMLTVQVNPYNALVIRGILGAVAALVYAVLGAADVALTEAMVGTMLSITLYAVAVRSSLVMRLGVLQDGQSEAKPIPDTASPLIEKLRAVARKYHLRLELVPYPDRQSLNQALLEKEVHVTCVAQSSPLETSQPYQTMTRIRRLHDIFQTELSALTTLTYLTPPTSGEQ
ncbi:MAG: DUF4040 domain-containing protein [Leptolyngbyaceae cyanobacterium SL_7_1]|nr:DUF4040 domain-containing protein [Leptolyngbyaceae cyanobacterium SL_7_1]